MLVYTFTLLGGLLAVTALFFFMATRGALIYRHAAARGGTPLAHVYPLYSDRRLIRLVDFQPVISAILLFQYHRLVSAIVAGLRRRNLCGREVLITSCAFGDVMPRVAGAALAQGAQRVKVIDIIQNELDHAARKLARYAGKIDMQRADAASLRIADASVAANVIFFLLHELPHELKITVLREAARVLEPGGQLFLAEFHRPDFRVLRALSWIYFKVYEPFGLALWDSHDPVRLLDEIGGFECERRTCCFGNFQIIVATKR